MKPLINYNEQKAKTITSSKFEASLYSAIMNASLDLTVHSLSTQSRLLGGGGGGGGGNY